MGDRWLEVAEPVRSLHSGRPVTRARGSLRVERGRHLLARVLARLLRLPRCSASADTQLIISILDGGECWQRCFDGRRFHTWQCEADACELKERYGLLEFRFGLRASGGCLFYIQREAALQFGTRRVVWPSHLAPRVEAREDPVAPERVNVMVRVMLPGIGLLIGYDGTIDVLQAPA
jgi:hypothetical protein